MAYPPGVSVAVISAGNASTFFGDDASISARVTPILKGTNRIIHTASGSVMIPAPMTFNADAGGVLQFQVPHVDQGGWVDAAGQAYTMWAYKVEITATFKHGRNSTSQKWVQNFQPVVGQDLIDLDLIGDGPVGEPVSAPMANVLSVNGRTGHVTISGDAATDSALQANLDAAKTYTDESIASEPLARSAVSTGTEMLLGDAEGRPSKLGFDSDGEVADETIESIRNKGVIAADPGEGGLRFQDEDGKDTWLGWDAAGLPDQTTITAIANATHQFTGPTEPFVYPGNYIVWTRTDEAGNPVETLIGRN